MESDIISIVRTTGVRTYFTIHESYHRMIVHKWMPPDGEWYIRFGEHPWIINPHTANRKSNLNDGDGDLIPNLVELQYNEDYGIDLDPNKADSYGLRSPYGDEEIMCWIFARNDSGNVSLDWSKGEYSKYWPTNR